MSANNSSGSQGEAEVGGPEDKVVRRRERNKELARRSRQKKKMQLQHLHGQVSSLSAENARLREHLHSMSDTIRTLQTQYRVPDSSPLLQPLRALSPLSPPQRVGSACPSPSLSPSTPSSSLASPSTGLAAAAPWPSAVQLPPSATTPKHTRHSMGAHGRVEVAPQRVGLMAQQGSGVLGVAPGAQGANGKALSDPPPSSHSGADGEAARALFGLVRAASQSHQHQQQHGYPQHNGQPPHNGQPHPQHNGQPQPQHNCQPHPQHNGQPHPQHNGQPHPQHNGQPHPQHNGQPHPQHSGHPHPQHSGHDQEDQQMGEAPPQHHQQPQQPQQQPRTIPAASPFSQPSQSVGRVRTPADGDHHQPLPPPPQQPRQELVGEQRPQRANGAGEAPQQSPAHAQA